MSTLDRRQIAARTLEAAMGDLLGVAGSPEAHFREVVERSLSSIALLAPDGLVLVLNARASAALGGDRNALTGIPLWDAPAWAAAAEMRQRLRASLAASARGVIVRQESGVAAPDGSTHLDLSFNPIADASGRVVLVLCEWRDVSDRKRAEAALRESEERFQRIVSIAVDAIISIDEAQRITLFNQGAEQIFGYHAAEVIGQPLDMLLPRELGSLHAKEVRGFGESRDEARRMGQRRQIIGRRKNGEIFHAEASISKATVGNQRVYTAVLRDVTERWAAEQEKSELLAATEAARRTAEDLARQRDEMLGMVSHDLRNPLSAISMCASLIAAVDTSPAERTRLAGTITESVDWCNRLIADLVDIASIEAKRLSIKRRRVDPVIAVGRALSLFEPIAGERGLRLEAAGVEHLPAVEADPERLLQVFANLLGNAVRHTSAGGTITIGADVDGSAVVFGVRDTGSGISPDHLPHVFERRWHTESGPHGGTGLGLSISRGIVEAHGGRIWVDSEPGRGSHFQFTIPLQPPEPPG